VLRQSPEFFETTQTGEVLSRLTTDTTLVQTVVGSSLSMGLRNAVMGVGALAMLVWTNPYVMTQVLLMLVLVVLPTMWFGRRVRKLSRASQDRVADSSAIAAEVLNAIPVVQSYTAEGREAARLMRPPMTPFAPRCGARAPARCWWPSSSLPMLRLLLWGLYQGTQAVLAGKISAGHLGQTVVYVIILAGAVAVLGEVYGDLLRAAGATERLMELLDTRSPIASPARRRAAPVTPRAARWRSSGDLSLPFTPRAGGAGGLLPAALRPARRWPWWGPAARARARCSSCCCAFTTPQSGAITLDGVPTSATGAARPAPAHRHRAAGRGDFLGQRAGEHPLRQARRHRRGSPRRRQRGVCRRLHRPCPRATTPSWANAACACRAGSASASRLPAPC
jgi:ATP-binding cassette subfamily B protein